MPRALITRPEPEASQWVQALAARGIDSAALPLLRIGPAPDGQALQHARERLDGYGAIMFVSSNAARQFFEQKSALPLICKHFVATNIRAWAPGPGSAATLQALGVPRERIDAPSAQAAQFDSEALWQQVRTQVAPGMRVLIVRGGDNGEGPHGSGRDWLSAQLRAAGAVVDYVAAYTRQAPHWGDAERRLAQTAAADGAWWVFSSAQCIANLCAALPQQHWGGARAIATHPRIAQAAREAGFGAVLASRPALADVAASIESAP